jgi:transposase
MQTVADRAEAPTAIRTDLGAIFVSLELSRSTWLITSLSPGGGEKMSKQVVRGGDVAGLLERFARLREKARARTGKVFPFVVIQEAGLDGFWIDRALQNEGIESHTGNPRLRTTLIQLAWLWLRHQPQSALTLWFEERVRRNGGRLKKTTIVALARKLLVALWKYVTAGVVIEGAVMKRT